MSENVPQHTTATNLYSGDLVCSGPAERDARFSRRHSHKRHDQTLRAIGRWDLHLLAHVILRPDLRQPSRRLVIQHRRQLSFAFFVDEAGDVATLEVFARGEIRFALPVLELRSVDRALVRVEAVDIEAGVDDPTCE